MSSSISRSAGQDMGILTQLGDLRISAKTLIYFQLIYVLLILVVNDSFSLPSSTLYLTDIVTILALLSCKKGSWSRFRKLGNAAVIAVFSIFCIVLAIGDIAHTVKPTLVLWGVRNSFRFFAFMYACASILESQDVRKIINMFFLFQIVNVVVTLWQYSQGFDGDHLGGIFGTQTGVNAYTNTFFCILLSYYAMFYVEGKESFSKFLFILISTLAISALAEIKLFYFEAAFVVAYVVAIRANRVRSLTVILIAVAAFMLALQLFAVVFPSAYEMLTNIDELIWYSTDNTGAVAGYNISRFGAFDDINSFIFHDDWLLNLFGIGFGNAGYSSYSMFTSDFYNIYGDLNYNFFTHQNWFIETGYVGYFLLIFNFVSLYLYCNKWLKRLPEESSTLAFVQLVLILTVVCFWYNQSLRIEVAYLTFFVMAIPFILVKHHNSVSERGVNEDFEES